MSAPAIKICGLTTPETLEATIAARADYAGFMFVAASPRYLNPDNAAALARQAEGRIQRVGVFVDAGDPQLARAVEAARLDVLQLHGNESPARVAELKARFGLPVWKVIPVASAEDLQRCEAFNGIADCVLFDAKTPKGSALAGGMGLSFDWSLIKAWKPVMPWGLAGGLSPANVAQALSLTGARLVDTSSGVESAPGIKDPARIAAFCEAARGA